MKQALLTTAVAAAALVASATYAWETVGADFSRGSLPNRSAVAPSSFGVKLFSLSEDGAGNGNAPNGNVTLYGEPASLPGRAALESETARLNNFGVSFQHRVGGLDRVTVSAERGESALYTTTLSNAADTRAALAWTRDWGGSLKPSLTSAFFLGDESGRDETDRVQGRRYMGLTVGGQLNLFKDHAPYVALQMRRNYYDAYATHDTLLPPTSRSDDTSTLSAGWRWQVERHMSLEAGASFGFGNAAPSPSSTLPTDPNSNRVFFGTRYDFR